MLTNWGCFLHDKCMLINVWVEMGCGVQDNSQEGVGGWGEQGVEGGLVELGWNVGRTKRGNTREAGGTVPVTWHKKSLDEGVLP